MSYGPRERGVRFQNSFLYAVQVGNWTGSTPHKRRHNGTKRFTHRLAGRISIVAPSSGTQLPASHSGIGCWGPLLLESQLPTLRDRRHIGSPMLVIDSSPTRMLKSSAKPMP